MLIVCRSLLNDQQTHYSKYMQQYSELNLLITLNLLTVHI